MAQAKSNKQSDPEAIQLGATIRRLRERNGWSMQRLAQEAGISQAAVFKIEKNRMSPSVAIVLKLARALKQQIGDLLAEKHEHRAARFYRATGREEIRFAEFPVAVLRLSGRLPDRELEAGIYIVDPGGGSTPKPMTHPGEEFYYVLEGRFRFEVDGEQFEMGAGESLHLKGEAPHRWENAGAETGRLLFTLTPPPFARPK